MKVLEDFYKNWQKVPFKWYHTLFSIAYGLGLAYIVTIVLTGKPITTWSYFMYAICGYFSIGTIAFSTLFTFIIVYLWNMKKNPEEEKQDGATNV